MIEFFKIYMNKNIQKVSQKLIYSSRFTNRRGNK